MIDNNKIEDEEEKLGDNEDFIFQFADNKTCSER